VRRRAGVDAGPLGVLLMLASLALTAYAGIRLLSSHVLGIVIWFVAAAVLHDLVLLPLYSLADRAVQALPGNGPGRPDTVGGPPPWLNHVRIPALLSGLLLLLFFPLVLGLVGHYHSYSALPAGVFWQHWLLLTAGFFAASATLFALRALRRPRRVRARRPGRER
jgi:hypothetical protein